MFANLLDSYAKAIKPATGQDSAEGNTQSFSTPTDTPPGSATLLWLNRPCSYQEASSHIVRYYQQRNRNVSNILYFDQDPGELTNCLIIVTRPATGDTILLNFVGSQDPVQWGASWVWPVACERIPQPA